MSFTHSDPPTSDEKRYTPRQFVLAVNQQVSYATLRRWDETGKLKANRNAANRRYYTEDHLEVVRQMLEENNNVQ